MPCPLRAKRLPCESGVLFGIDARNTGVSVSLMGAGTQTVGVLLVHQFRMIDPTARTARIIERAPDHITEEVRARVAALLE